MRDLRIFGHAASAFAQLREAHHLIEREVKDSKPLMNPSHNHALKFQIDVT
jgi:hypothetical protein